MRVIAGSAKGRKLITREGQDTRPTTDKLKESVFAVMQFEVPESRFLDLFSGSGGIGIEALSRGAESAVFVESSSMAAGCIMQNIRTIGFVEQAELMKTDVLLAIRQLGAAGRKFDIIFMDPPYEKGFEQKTLEAIKEYDILAPEGLVVVESSVHTPIDPVQGHLEIEKVKDYKVTKFTFLRGI